jgi:glycosyltransferase involved in cell wall biosynthesis
MPEKIKIVYLIGQLGLGGSERQLYLLLKHFSPVKIEASVIVFNPSHNTTLNTAIEQLGFHVFPIPQNCRGIMQRFSYIYRLLRRLSPDIVHSWTIHDNPYAGIAGRLAGVPLRWGSARGSILAHGFSNLPAVYKWLSMFSVQKIVVNTKPTALELGEKGVHSRKIIVLPNGVEIPVTVNESTINTLPGLEMLSGKRVIGLVGNLRKIKNHFMFIEGLSKILTDYSDVYGIIVGQPIPGEMDYYQAIQNKVADPNLGGHVILAGFQDNVASLMNQFSVFCLTSDYEGMPNVILEAMAASRQVSRRLSLNFCVIKFWQTGWDMQAGKLSSVIIHAR